MLHDLGTDSKEQRCGLGSFRKQNTWVNGYLNTFYLGEEEWSRARVVIGKEAVVIVFFWKKERFGHFVVVQSFGFGVCSGIFIEPCFCLVHNHGESSPDVKIMGGC